MEAGRGLIDSLANLFNLSIMLRQVPDEWKSFIVPPVFKGGRKDRAEPSNYRLISLTSCVARTLEKLINKQLRSSLNGNKLLYQHQSGFLPEHSTGS